MKLNSKRCSANHLISLISATILASSATSCGESETPSCYQVIEDYQTCMDDFCTGEGDGTIFCDCWIRGYGARMEGCQCYDSIWIVGARGLCEERGAEDYSDLINCEVGISQARTFIDSCG